MSAQTDPAALVQRLRERAYTGDAEDEKLLLAAASAIERLAQERDEIDRICLQWQSKDAVWGAIWKRLEADYERLAQENERLLSDWNAARSAWAHIEARLTHLRTDDYSVALWADIAVLRRVLQGGADRVPPEAKA